MDSPEALPILARYTSGLTDGARVALLTETAVVRTVNAASVTLYDPYAAAVAHLMHPDTLKARTEGEVSETYVDFGPVVRYLEGQSALLRLTFPLDDSLSTLKPYLNLNIVGWG